MKVGRNYRALILDTETTALVSNTVLPEKHQPEVIEYFGHVLDTSTMEIGSELEFLCKPRQPITDEITKITGITNADLVDKLAFSVFAPSVMDQIQSVDAVVAHNLSYDMWVLSVEMQRCGLGEQLVWPKRRICTVEATEWIKGYRLKLTDLHEYLFEKPPPLAHRAREDVETLTRCFCELFKRGDL